MLRIISIPQSRARSSGSSGSCSTMRCSCARKSMPGEQGRDDTLGKRLLGERCPRIARLWIGPMPGRPIGRPVASRNSSDSAACSLLMRILLLNQTFYPDVVATAQYLTSLAEALARRDHEVRVLAARRAYDEPARRFAKRERHGLIEIERVGGTGFGKDAKWRRAVDFGSFFCGWRRAF